MDQLRLKALPTEAYVLAEWRVRSRPASRRETGGVHRKITREKDYYRVSSVKIHVESFRSLA